MAGASIVGLVWQEVDSLEVRGREGASSKVARPIHGGKKSLESGDAAISFLLFLVLFLRLLLLLLLLNYPREFVENVQVPSDHLPHACDFLRAGKAWPGQGESVTPFFLSVTWFWGMKLGT